MLIITGEVVSLSRRAVEWTDKKTGVVNEFMKCTIYLSDGEGAPTPVLVDESDNYQVGQKVKLRVYVKTFRTQGGAAFNLIKSKDQPVAASKAA